MSDTCFDHVLRQFFTYLLTDLAICWCHSGTGSWRREIVQPMRSFTVHPVGKRLALAALKNCQTGSDVSTGLDAYR